MIPDTQVQYLLVMYNKMTTTYQEGISEKRLEDKTKIMSNQQLFLTTYNNQEINKGHTEAKREKRKGIH
jgi:hypothetical protein